jgi:adrenodoxin-NADP+ reductase
MGVIATTMYDAYQTADCIIADLKAGVVGAHAQGAVSSSRQELLDWLRTVQNARPVTFADWKRVEQEEERRGKLLGKPREKLSSVEDILRVIDELNGRAAGQQ